jgi:hypothetical protein
MKNTLFIFTLLLFGLSASSVYGAEKVLTWEMGENDITEQVSNEEFGSFGFLWTGFIGEVIAQSPSKTIQDLVSGIAGWVCEGTACQPQAGPWASDLGFLTRSTPGYGIGWNGSSMVVAGDAWCGGCRAVGAKTFYIGDREANSPINLSFRADAFSSYYSMVTNAYVSVYAGRNNATRLIISDYAYFPRYGYYNNNYARDLRPLLNATDNVVKIGLGVHDNWIANWNQRAWFSNMNIAYNYTPPTYSVSFQKIGAENASWGVVVGGTHYMDTEDTISVENLTGTVSYEYDDIAQGTSGTRYVCESGCSGSVEGPSTSTATYGITEYQLLMQVSSPGSGTTSPGTGAYYPQGSSVQISASAFDGWQFLTWQGSGTESYTGQNNPVTITMESPITQTAIFEEIFAQAGILCSRNDIEYDPCEAYIFQANTPFYILDNSTTPQGVTIEEREWTFSPDSQFVSSTCAETDGAGCRKLQTTISETGTYEVELTLTDNLGRDVAEQGELLILEISPRYREIVP